jgi:hypothetical protein
MEGWREGGREKVRTGEDCAVVASEDGVHHCLGHPVVDLVLGDGGGKDLERKGGREGEKGREEEEK